MIPRNENTCCICYEPESDTVDLLPQYCCAYRICRSCAEYIYYGATQANLERHCRDILRIDCPTCRHNILPHFIDNNISPQSSSNSSFQEVPDSVLLYWKTNNKPPSLNSTKLCSICRLRWPEGHDRRNCPLRNARRRFLEREQGEYNSNRQSVEAQIANAQFALEEAQNDEEYNAINDELSFLRDSLRMYSRSIRPINNELQYLNTR